MVDVRSQVTLRPRSKLERLIETLAEMQQVPARPELDVLSQMTLMHLVRCGADPRTALVGIEALCGKEGLVDAAKLAAAPRDVVAPVCAEAQVDEALASLHAAGEAVQKLGIGLDTLCRADLEEGRRLLRALPGMNEQRADLLLLYAGVQAVVAPTSSAMRVVVRIGYPGAAYASVARALDEELPSQPGVDLAWRAHHALDQHGRSICTAKQPHCQRCPIRDACAFHGNGDDPAQRLARALPER